MGMLSRPFITIVCDNPFGAGIGYKMSAVDIFETFSNLCAAVTPVQVLISHVLGRVIRSYPALISFTQSSRVAL